VNAMVSIWGLPGRALWLLAGAGLPLLLLAQNAGNTPKIAPVPADPLELVTGPVHRAGTQAERDAALQLLGRARDHFALRNAGVPYDLKATFTADSGGQTNYDGAWEMENLYAPKLGTRWTAKAAAGYALTVINSHGNTYAEGAATALPLRLHEARGLLMDPLPSTDYASRGSIRTATATFHGVAVTCLLLSRTRTANPATGRGWEENEECIDPQSGLLQMHSEAPGRYAVYDYTNSAQLRGHVLPHTVTVIEAGKAVSQISVESLTENPGSDLSAIAPNASMKTGADGVAISGTTKVSRIHGQEPFTSAMTVRTVCVFGVVTSGGQLVEAHSLQPSDPNSDAAVADAKSINFALSIPAGTPAQQHFVFVIERFVSAQ
jgi:hypothetical protein